MEITEVRIKLMEDNSGSNERLQAFCSITFDDMFVIRDLKIIEGAKGFFVAMPSRKLTDRCHNCGTKNHLRSRFCNQCGCRLDENRVRDADGRAKLHADIAHPINSMCREKIQAAVLASYAEELERSKMPGYVSRYDEYEPDEFDLQYEGHPGGAPPMAASNEPPLRRDLCGAIPSIPAAISPSCAARTSLLARRARPKGLAPIIIIGASQALAAVSKAIVPWSVLAVSSSLILTESHPESYCPDASRLTDRSINRLIRPGAKADFLARGAGSVFCASRSADKPYHQTDGTRTETVGNIFRVGNGKNTLTDTSSTSAGERSREHRSNAADKRLARRSSVRRIAMRIVRDLVVIYLGFLTLLYSFQTRVIFPARALRASRSPRWFPARPPSWSN